MKFARCTRVATFIPICLRCAASATARHGASSKVSVRSTNFGRTGIAATRQLAKRQMTWLRSMPDVSVIEPTVKAALSTVELL